MRWTVAYPYRLGQLVAGRAGNQDNDVFYIQSPDAVRLSADFELYGIGRIIWFLRGPSAALGLGLDSPPRPGVFRFARFPSRRSFAVLAHCSIRSPSSEISGDNFHPSCLFSRAARSRDLKCVGASFFGSVIMLSVLLPGLVETKRPWKCRLWESMGKR